MPLVIFDLCGQRIKKEPVAPFGLGCEKCQLLDTVLFGKSHSSKNIKTVEIKPIFLEVA